MTAYISVIVCTHNRVNILRVCLESLVNQTLKKELYEVIIIDNCSTDQTAPLSDHFIDGNANFRCIYESELGLSNARNRGWRAARGEYIAYIDDDALAEPNWLEEMYSFISKCPEASVFGGPYEGYALVDLPDWFPSDYGSLNLGDIDRPIEVGKEWISGANIVFKKEALILSNGFQNELGMKGKKLAYGEETRLIKDLFELGYDVHYAAKMKVKHLIAEYKMSLWWLLKSNYSYGRVASTTLNKKFTLWDCFKKLIYEIVLFLKIFIEMDGPLKSRLHSSLKGVFFASGVFVSYFCILSKNLQDSMRN